MKAHLRIFITGMICLASLCSSLASAQTQLLTSTVDQGLGVKRIAILPLVDNVSNIYAGPLTERIYEYLSKDRRFDVVKLDLQKITPEKLEDEIPSAKALLQQVKSDALLVGRITKGPQGINMRLSLIGGSDMLPITQERLENYSGFDLEDMRAQTDLLMKGLLGRMPYQALVTSRQGQLITLNAGANHGLRVGDEIFAVLITGVKRHPKFKFITQVDREIMGKVKLSKVDESVSFGSLTAERTANLIQSGFKLTWSSMINYPETGITKSGDIVPRLSESPDAPVAYGDNPREWRTGQDASFGKVSLLVGFGQTSLASTHTNGTSPSGQNNFSPVIRIDGEMWLDPKWQLNIWLEQLATKIPNSGSSPDPLSVQMQEMSFLVSHNFLTEEENFWGPKFQLLGGMSRLAIKLDDSNPRAHTGKEYSSLVIGLGGSFPILTETGSRYLLGGKFIYHLQPKLSENPTTSGSSSDTLTHFNVFLEYDIAKNLAFRSDLNFKQATSSFSGGTSSSASANFITLLAGATFYF